MTAPVTPTRVELQIDVLLEPDDLNETLPRRYRSLTDLLLERALDAIQESGEAPAHLESDDTCHWYVLGVDTVPSKPAANGVIFRVEVTYR